MRFRRGAPAPDVHVAVGKAGVDACPAGHTVIRDRSNCDAAAAWLGLPFDGPTSDPAGECVLERNSSATTDATRSALRVEQTHHSGKESWVCLSGSAFSSLPSYNIKHVDQGTCVDRRAEGVTGGDPLWALDCEEATTQFHIFTVDESTGTFVDVQDVMDWLVFDR